jgi:uncharacterized membrane protein YfcA
MAYFGASLFRRLSNRALSRVILVLLLGTGLLMMAESVIGEQLGAMLGDDPAIRLPAALVLGAGVGLVISLMGVGGNELMIPLLVLLFGIEIKAAGTASLAVSLPTVIVGLWRFHALGTYRHDARENWRTILPLAASSVVGATAGGFLAPNLPGGTLKFLLGLILIFSAWRSFRDRPTRA